MKAFGEPRDSHRRAASYRLPNGPRTHPSYRRASNYDAAYRVMAPAQLDETIDLLCLGNNGLLSRNARSNSSSAVSIILSLAIASPMPTVHTGFSRAARATGSDAKLLWLIAEQLRFDNALLVSLPIVTSTLVNRES